jgi:hypothetical protein
VRALGAGAEVVGDDEKAAFLHVGSVQPRRAEAFGEGGA